MKKLLLIAAALCLVTGSAFAVPTIDGSISPSNEWDTWYLKGSDPNEGNIDDNYDLKLVYAWWDSSDVYIRTDVYGTPTLAKQDSGNMTPAFYQWNIDTTGDFNTDLIVVLELANQSGGNDRVRLYKADWTALGYGPAALGSIVEGSFATSLVPSGLEPSSPSDVSMYVRMDNAGGDPDDRLPNTGWTTGIPEPSSMLLLGIGLIGLSGGAVRRKVTA